MLIFYALMAGIASLIMWFQGKLHLIGFGVGPGLLLQSCILGCGAGLLLVAGSRVATSRFQWAKTLGHEFGRVLGPMTCRQIVLLGLASGIGEELLFRGVIQPWLGLWPATIIFGLLHVGSNAKFVPWTILALLAGLLFGLLLIFTHTVAAPMCAHIIVNVLNLRAIAKQRTKKMDWASSEKEENQHES